jgi:hypothetical protein
MDNYFSSPHLWAGTARERYTYFQTDTLLQPIAIFEISIGMSQNIILSSNISHIWSDNVKELWHVLYVEMDKEAVLPLFGPLMCFCFTSPVGRKLPTSSLEHN